jgi:iron complex outermembrane receptor protein/hemoglobin/transferrin/lactoferrin receptor protein
VPLTPRPAAAIAFAALSVLAPRAAAQDHRDEMEDDEAEDGEPFRASARAAPDEMRGRSSSTVERAELEERVVRSTPDALRVVPGVTVQQTAHGQASPYVRGLTGQEVLLAFDGIRINNGIFRQGPNQYFFTVDPWTVERIHVLRGSASTRWGSDAIGGAILTVPRDPTFDPSARGITLHPRAIGRFGSQDLDATGRAELDVQLGRELAFLGGVAYRAAHRLEGGGIVCNLAGEPCVPAADPAMRRGVPPVPYVESDGRTQRGTGFRVLSWDQRLVWRPRPRVRVTAAAYGFHQFDTPRTDQCPPPQAPGSDCLLHLQQTRALAYAAIDLAPEGDLAELRAVVSWQRVFEHRVRDRPTAFVENTFRDTIDTFGVTLRGATRPLPLARDLALAIRFGGEGYADGVRSEAQTSFTDVGVTVRGSRGQYVDRARSALLGAWAEGELGYDDWLVVRGGVRGQYAGARAGADPTSGTRAVHADFGGVVARAGVELTPGPELSILANVDQGFRAPNLDDLTSRQQAGPGFQFESPDLREERSLSFELGARVAPIPELHVEGWAYAIELDGAMARIPRSMRDCPPATPQCGSSTSRFQLVNLAEPAWVLGGELAATVDVRSIGLLARATFAGAWGEGPSPLADGTRVPLSRVPPVNGLVDARWRHAETGLSVGATFRWALDQTRLAPADLGDARIPLGGTPGYALLDIRAGWELERWIGLYLVFENVFDAAYRVHGSSINGPGRGLLVLVDAGL